MGGNIYDVVWVSIDTTCGMNAHLYHIVGLSMLDAEDLHAVYRSHMPFCMLYVLALPGSDRRRCSRKL